MRSIGQLLLSFVTILTLLAIFQSHKFSKVLIPTLIFSVPSGFYLWTSGQRRLDRFKWCSDLALCLYNKHGYINIKKLSRITETNENEVIRTIENAKLKGLINDEIFVDQYYDH
tara:strand:- start:8 stop:349 length:342 start_codon:yes stop_codon:yes gene_type:complete